MISKQIPQEYSQACLGITSLIVQSVARLTIEDPAAPASLPVGHLLSWRLILALPLIQEGRLSFTSEIVCTLYIYL